jgi:hypothetical protein
MTRRKALPSRPSRCVHLSCHMARSEVIMDMRTACCDHDHDHDHDHCCDHGHAYIMDMRTACCVLWGRGQGGGRAGTRLLQSQPANLPTGTGVRHRAPRLAFPCHCRTGHWLPRRLPLSGGLQSERARTRSSCRRLPLKHRTAAPECQQRPWECHTRISRSAAKVCFNGTMLTGAALDGTVKW